MSEVEPITWSSFLRAYQYWNKPGWGERYAIDDWRAFHLNDVLDDEIDEDPS